MPPKKQLLFDGKKWNTGSSYLLDVELLMIFLYRLFFCCILFSYAYAKECPPDVPAILTSDSLDHDADKEITTATGNVRITQGPKVLSADKVSYNRKTDTIHASGNVWFKDTTGEIYFSEDSVFTNKMQDGFTKEIKGIMLDNGRLAARTGQRIHGCKMIFNNGLYSPCNVCKANPDIAPLWQMKANKIIHNKEEKIVEYHHMRMETYGIPFLYTPYFRHADPTVKRKSGILKPEYGHNSDLGFFLSVPYYITFDQNYDATLIPIFTSSHEMIMKGEYRHRLRDGNIYINGSFKDNHSEKKKFKRENPRNLTQDHKKHRWHLFINGRYDLSDEHLLTVDINRASDTTYLQKYPVLPQGYALLARQSVLTSMMSLEQFKNTSYASLRGYAFQTDPAKVSPYIIPLAEASYESMPGCLSETWSFDTNILSLHRVDPVIGRGPADMIRTSFGAGFQIPFTSRWGDIWQLKSTMRWDYYTLDDYRVRPSTEPAGESHMARLYPAISLGWRYPWVAYFTNSSWILEPNAAIISSTQGNNTVYRHGSLIPIPNEDSVYTTLDQTTLFAMNRFYGIDRVDTGHRFVYGGKSKMYFSNCAKLFLFFGQSIRLDNRRVLSVGSGEHRKASNYITGVHFSPGWGLDIQNRAMFNKKDFALRISESTASWNTKICTLSTTHTYLNKRVTRTPYKTSQITWAVTSKPYHNWSVSYGETRNLKPERLLTTNKREKTWLVRSLGLNFQNECLGARLAIAHTAFEDDKGLRPAQTVLFTIDFKNIGSISPLSFFGNPFDVPAPGDINTKRR